MTTTPRHLTLGEVIDRLEQEDPATRIAVGFHRPHSYRGYYDEVAFEVTTAITIADMLNAARGALGATFQGWKGGDYTMSEHTAAWLVQEEGDCGENLGAVLLDALLAARASDQEPQP